MLKKEINFSYQSEVMKGSCTLSIDKEKVTLITGKTKKRELNASARKDSFKIEEDLPFDPVAPKKQLSIRQNTTSACTRLISIQLLQNYFYLNIA